MSSIQEDPDGSVAPVSNNPIDYYGETFVPERSPSAPPSALGSDNIFSIFPGPYGGIFSGGNLNQNYRYPQQNMLPVPEQVDMNGRGTSSFGPHSEPKPKVSPLWGLTMPLADLEEEALIPDFNSDSENPGGDEHEDEQAFLSSNGRDPHSIADNRYNQFAWSEQQANLPVSFSSFGYNEDPGAMAYSNAGGVAGMNHLLASQRAAYARADYSAPFQAPSGMMPLRNPMMGMQPGPSYPSFDHDPLLDGPNQLAPQPNPSFSHQRTKSDSYIGPSFFDKSYSLENSLENLSLSGDASGNPPVCRYFTNGYCIRGERCNFAHVRAEQAAPVKDKVKAPRPAAAPQRNGRRARAGNVSPESVKPPVIDGKNDDILSRFHSIEQVTGSVYRICKDQHGCRFLQKKLEEKDKNPRSVEIIFEEVYDHMVELMTDPFGNYLCQKLIEHCNEQQQLFIVQKVAPHLVSISKNMHGTRAVQKMIECLCTPAQVQLVVNALKSSVVPLIQDLNGNHVIQRCLHRLSVQDKQFVYDAVAAHCVEVATHRHGCCVMQRCIDFASEDQKLQLVREIARNVLVLVQDPFGNYVVQYVLDLSFSLVKVSLIQQFLGHLSILSTQKFSSNVIEKCLHVAEDSVKAQLIDELMMSQNLGGLLQDPYGNYVIQTALSESYPQQRARLVDQIRPLLPMLRNTPYGKRIQNKISKDANEP